MSEFTAGKKVPNYPQDGSPLTRELWLGKWPISKNCNEWVYAFGLTYTLIVTDNGPPFANWKEAYLIVVGPKGVRFDHLYEGNAYDVKDLLWPEGREKPLTLVELEAANPKPVSP